MDFWGILGTALDAVLPRRERRIRAERRSAEDISLFPQSHELLGARILTLMDYRELAASDVIRSLKYDRSGHAATLCAAILADYLREELSSARTFSARRALLIPVPLHATRERERGFNQMVAVLHALPEEFLDGTLSYMEARALRRVRATPPQTRLSRRERLANVAGAFAADADSVRDAHVILIDDVTTTGATLAEAAKPLAEAGATVTLIALARA